MATAHPAPATGRPPADGDDRGDRQHMNDSGHTMSMTGAVDRAEVEDVLVRVVGALAPESVERAEPGQALIRDLGYHSLRLVELGFALEELFDMEPTTIDDAPPTGTVAALTEYLVGRIEQGLGT